MTETPAAPARGLTPHFPLKRIEIVINPRSGSVGAKAALEAEALMQGYACDFRIAELDPERMGPTLDDAFSAEPDLIVVLAGDGTARTVAARAGPDGPAIAPLPGGTMNMLPRALYGTTDWRQALESALTEGVEHTVAGGEINGEAFYVAAILGSPALWAPAREAVRTGKLRLAWLYGRRAMRRAFSHRARFQLENDPFRRGEALVLLSPMISKALDRPVGLEAALLDPAGAREVFHLAATAAFSDWRHDPSVKTRTITRARAMARRPIPAIIDGETMHLGSELQVKFVPRAFRALAPKPEAAADSV
ncbi:diacylglycerol kinase family protein [Brevundimonas sp. 2R-24]|uniref:Diacylglycerol kinase family protein n=1 Tax=Peiella sedimenti TaxID=3061083 RepID=A0ABT8SL46_9CAUL|nr:diacylglycerol kinase family protein [Caulobacteraceae bacterium XZ-24]